MHPLQRVAEAIHDALRSERSEQRVAEVQAAAASVRDALLADFRAQRASYERMRDAFAGDGLPLAALSACGRGTAEIRFTQLLAYFLDPENPHGLGSRCLEAIFGPELRLGPEGRQRPSLADAQVHVEYSLGIAPGDPDHLHSTVDLLVETPTHVLLVEQKIGAGEQVGSEGMGQLRRYRKAFLANRADRFPDRRQRFFYLTPSGKEPSSLHWDRISHKEIIDRLADLCRGGNGLSTTARHNLRCLVWDLMLGPLSFDAADRDEFLRLLDRALDYELAYFELQGMMAYQGIDMEWMLKTLEE